MNNILTYFIYRQLARFAFTGVFLLISHERPRQGLWPLIMRGINKATWDAQLLQLVFNIIMQILLVQVYSTISQNTKIDNKTGFSKCSLAL